MENTINYNATTGKTGSTQAYDEGRMAHTSEKYKRLVERLQRRTLNFTDVVVKLYELLDQKEGSDTKKLE